MQGSMYYGHRNVCMVGGRPLSTLSPSDCNVGLIPRPRSVRQFAGSLEYAPGCGLLIHVELFELLTV